MPSESRRTPLCVVSPGCQRSSIALWRAFWPSTFGGVGAGKRSEDGFGKGKGSMSLCCRRLVISSVVNGRKERLSMYLRSIFGWVSSTRLRYS